MILRKNELKLHSIGRLQNIGMLLTIASLSDAAGIHQLLLTGEWFVRNTSSVAPYGMWLFHIKQFGPDVLVMDGDTIKTSDDEVSTD